LALLAEACPVPVVVIGGIRAENVPDCLAAGAKGVAVMGGVMRATNPAEAVTQVIAALSDPQPRPR
jgi:thiamine monophosphate synthase